MVITLLKVKVVTLNKNTLKQIEKVCGNKNGVLKGYVIDEFGMATFIGEENGKLYSTRQDYMPDTFTAKGKAVGYDRHSFSKLIDELKASLPQIFTS
ncbi:hypothetical protein LCGC14_0543570 [marine sediment metagenome]|uniref:Uncharacterized protein n=1 Tax=marine sediment metagenome TaxID=412755 RepID=A0A0F9V080_9ZZZZ